MIKEIPGLKKTSCRVIVHDAAANTKVASTKSDQINSFIICFDHQINTSLAQAVKASPDLSHAIDMATSIFTGCSVNKRGVSQTRRWLFDIYQLPKHFLLLWSKANALSINFSWLCKDYCSCQNQVELEPNDDRIDIEDEVSIRRAL